MARYIAEDKELTKNLHSSSEEEEINRRLKAAGLYDHEETYEARRTLDEVLQKSKEESLSTTNLGVGSWQTATSFEKSFNIVDDDDEDILVELSLPINISANKNGRKPAEWKPLSGDQYDDEVPVPIEELSNYTQRKSLNPPKDKHVDVKKLALTVTEGYGRKMVVASLKKGEKNKSQLPIRSLRERRGDLIITPDELSDSKGVRETQSRYLDKSRDPSKDEETNGTIDSENDDFLAIARHKNSQIRGKSDVCASGSKTKIETMRTLFNKYSEMLKKIEEIAPSSLPEHYDFESKGPYQQLIENEEQSKIAQHSYSRPIKWRKPIILTVSNNRKRRQMFKKSTTSDTCPPVDTKMYHQDNIICDSPPSSSVTKLDLSPASPVFESSTSRKRQGGSKEIIETGIEIDSESTINFIQDSSFQECPICGKSFPFNVIETHADGCINNIQEEARPRSERIAARSTKSRNGWHDSSQWEKGLVDHESNVRPVPGKGSESAVGKRISTTPELDASETIFDTDSDSDFEARNDSGTKRNQRKIEVSKVKKRRF